MDLRRPLALLLAVSLTGCQTVRVTMPQGRPLPGSEPGRDPSKRLKVAVMPFDNLSESNVPVGETAANLFTQHLLNIRQYDVIGESVTEKTVKVESTVESEGSGGRSKEKVNVTRTEKGVDPIAWGKKHGVDAVVVGSVTRYRERRGFIFPPAAVSIEARLIHVDSRKVLWSATDHRGYGVLRWATFIVWPVGVVLAFFSPHAESRLRDSAHKTVLAVQEKMDWEP